MFTLLHNERVVIQNYKSACFTGNTVSITLLFWSTYITLEILIKTSFNRELCKNSSDTHVHNHGLHVVGNALVYENQSTTVKNFKTTQEDPHDHRPTQ